MYYHVQPVGYIKYKNIFFYVPGAVFSNKTWTISNLNIKVFLRFQVRNNESEYS